MKKKVKVLFERHDTFFWKCKSATGAASPIECLMMVMMIIFRIILMGRARCDLVIIKEG